jgi:hypothetical protein
MATRKKKIEEDAPAASKSVQTEPIPVINSDKPGVIKEFMQNGMRYQRIRKEDGSTVDVRIA